MKHFASIALLAPLVGCMLPAQPTPPPPPPPRATVIATPTPPRVIFTAEQLDVLLGPIALYPDALLALILPASTNSADLVTAARYLQANGDPAQVDAQPWDDSVRSLAHYPQVVIWMSENIVWTNQLGDAFDNQPTDVMNAVQRLRARARDAGTLVSTPQQQVIFEGSTILIVPAQPEVIYVPYYDPAVVYVSRGYYDRPYASYFGFSSGFAVGWWMSYGLDWRDRCVLTINRDSRQRFWHEHQHDWHRSNWSRDTRESRPEVQTWRPRPGSPSRHAPNLPSGGSRGSPNPGWRERTEDRDHDGRGRENRAQETDRRERSRSDERDRRGNEPTSTRPTGVGSAPAYPAPTAPSGVGPAPARIDNRPAMNRPAPPPSAPPLQQTPPPSWSRGNRGNQEENRHRAPPSPPPPQPAPSVAPQATMGPVPPPQVNPGRASAPTPAAMGIPMQRPSYSPPAPSPAAAPPAPTPAQAQPAPSQPSQSNSQSTEPDENRRRSPFIRR